MTLQILVNHYKENPQIITNFLASLESQKNVDFEVIIGSDGADRLEEEFLNQFNLNLTYKYLPHSGMCHTRNLLLDLATADYVMFCDIDDCFISPDGLSALMTIAEQTEADIIGSPYLSENFFNNEYTYEVLKRDMIRVHGKIFKRQYLVDQNIRYPDEIEIAGDMMFLWLSYMLTRKIVWTRNIFYMYKYNPSSLTRYSPLAAVQQYKATIHTYILTAHEAEKRKMKPQYEQLVCNTIYFMYLNATSNRWVNLPEKESEEVESITRIFLQEFYPVYQKVDSLLKKRYFILMKNSKSFYKNAGNFGEIEKWIEQILN